MKTLIVDDDFVSSLALQKARMAYGESHIAVNGKEAVRSVLQLPAGWAVPKMLSALTL